MSGQTLITIVGRDQLSHGRRKESRHLLALTLDRGQKPDVVDRDRGLMSERLDEIHGALRGPRDLLPAHGEDADELSVFENRDAQRRAVVTGFPYTFHVPLRVGEDVLDPLDAP